MPTIDNDWFDDKFPTAPYMAILRGFDRDTALELAAQASTIGITLVEIPLQRPRDVATLTSMARQAQELGQVAGAGTIRTLEQLESAASAGARFIVSPSFNPEIVTEAARRGIPVLPGVGSATEVDAALRLGLRWLKAFPAIALGSVWISQMAGPFPEAKFVATGGMTAATAEEFLKAGASGIAVGSAIRDLVSAPTSNQRREQLAVHGGAYMRKLPSK